MKFTKMHGAGNDYIYINCFEESVPDPVGLSIKLSDRHFGIGGDGIVLIKKSDVADFMMDMYNADGSRGKMCGNAIRCVTKYVVDNNLTDKKDLSIETLSGIKHIHTYESEGSFFARVNMGAPIITPKDIPVDMPGESIVSRRVSVGEGDYDITCVSMGNPHCVVFADEVDSIAIEKIGPLFENYSAFPDRINTEFVKIINENLVQMRVWERGSGETWACGTGACAVVVACVLNGKCRRGDVVTVQLRGGDLQICWEQDGTVTMTGSAVTVFEGEVNI